MSGPPADADRDDDPAVMHPSADDHDAEALIAAAERRRRSPRGRQRSAPRADPVARAVDSVAIADPDSPTVADDRAPRRRRRMPAAMPPDTDGEAMVVRPRRRRPAIRDADRGPGHETGQGPDRGTDGDGPGVITRGVHAGLDGAGWAGGTARRVGLWGCTAAIALAMVAVVSGIAFHQVPQASPVAGIRIAWLPGPQVADREVLAWIQRFPARDQLCEANDWVLERLCTFLGEQPAVAEVRQVRLVSEPVAATGDDPAPAARRLIELQIGLREPRMPAVLSGGERVWIDRDGHILPGIMPAPGVRRPVLRGVEAASRETLLAAIAAWDLLEPRIEPGLVNDIRLDDAIDERGSRGIVLVTRHGSRLIWGRPSEERFGIRPEDKATDLIATLRGQGDLRRVASVNVRFRQPVFTLRE